MTIQQRRLFFPAATSKQRPDKKLDLGVVNTCFRPWGWIGAILSAALLIGCTSLTHDRVNVIADIAGQAAAVGAAEWLAKHPGHRDAFEAVIVALTAVHKNGNTNEQALEYAFVERMASLPTDSLRGPDGELYLTSGSTNATRSAQGGLVVWDAHLKKSVAVTGASTRPVLKATLIGLKRAMVPKPPAPVVARARRVEDLEGRAGEGDGGLSGRSDLRFATRGNVALGILGTLTPTNGLHVNAATNRYVTNGIMFRTNLTASTFDVTLNEHGIQQVNVRWTGAPGIYTVQRSEDGKPWEGYACVTNVGVWTTLWPAPVAVGQWRVIGAR